MLKSNSIRHTRKKFFSRVIDIAKIVRELDCAWATTNVQTDKATLYLFNIRYEGKTLFKQMSKTSHIGQSHEKFTSFKGPFHQNILINMGDIIIALNLHFLVNLILIFSLEKLAFRCLKFQHR